MKFAYSAILASLFIVGDANAQESVVEDAVEAVAAAAEAQRVTSPAPPIEAVLTIPPPSAPMETEANPSPKSWRLGRGQLVDYPPSSWAADEEGCGQFSGTIGPRWQGYFVRDCQKLWVSGFGYKDMRNSNGARRILS